MDKVICIVGPTAIGKTSLAIALAQQFNTEIINGDAIQVYKEIDIISAKATKQEQAIIKHHLLDYLDISESLDIAIFKNEATQLIKELNKIGKIPIIVGGSGLYLKSLLYDYNFTNIKGRQEEISEKYKNFNNYDLFKYLEKIDYEASLKLHENNRKRVLRAIEIYENNQISKSEFIASQKHDFVFDVLIIGLNTNREILYDRINNRVDQMIKDGMLEEARMLYNKYDKKNYQALNAIGYKELVDYFEGISTLEQAIDKIKQNSRRYAKKQLTWFKNQMDVNWINVDINDFSKTINQAIEMVEVKFNER